MHANIHVYCYILEISGISDVDYSIDTNSSIFLSMQKLFERKNLYKKIAKQKTFRKSLEAL